LTRLTSGEPAPDPTAPVADRARAVVARLESERDAQYLADLATRYGIHTDHAIGVRMNRIKAIARGLGTDHDLAGALWATGVYEARLLASMVDDPGAVTPGQMDAWCAAFDTWAVVDTVCFTLFDRTPHAWEAVDRWAACDEEFVKRAGFALLWSLANHDRAAPDARFAAGLALIERTGGDGRHLVDKAIGMALRAIGKRRPALRDEALAVAERLSAADDPATRRIGCPAVRALART
jgi:3-methyladenine DNA glycosylase AlkD